MKTIYVFSTYFDINVIYFIQTEQKDKVVVLDNICVTNADKNYENELDGSAHFPSEEECLDIQYLDDGKYTISLY